LSRLTNIETLVLKQGERGQTDHTREDLRQMQTQIDELKSENSALQVQITEQKAASNV